MKKQFSKHAKIMVVHQVNIQFILVKLNFLRSLGLKFLINILYVYQADKSPNTNFCYQAKFFICLYTYYEGHYWPKELLIYVWTLKII